MIRLNVFFALHDQEKRAKLNAAATELVEKSRGDKGVVAYDFFASQTINAHFMICETWIDRESLEAHSKTEHFTRLVSKIEHLCGALKLEEFQF